ncbi:MAG: peptidase [Proteobacteria bacterium HN_bin10]|nr:MAG: peptidase [Proteobacteria bacterium HN_bin10]
MTLHATQDLPQLAADVLAQAKQRGATQADVMVADGRTFSVQVRLATVDRLTKAREKRLGLRVFVGKRSASVSTSDFSRESLAGLVEETCALARAVVEDEASGLPDPSLMTQERLDLGIYDPTELSTDAQIEAARRAETAAMSADARIVNSEGADFNSAAGRVVLANSHGFLGDYRSSSFSLSVSPIAAEPGGTAMQRDSWYDVRRTYGMLASPESVGVEAARRTVRRLGAKKVGTTKAPVIFDQETAASVLGHLCSAVSGYAVYKGASFLIGRLGQVIASDCVTVTDNGLLPGGLGSRPFDGEGLPTRMTTVVEQGCLASYLLDSYSGRKLGLASTGNASRAVGESPSVGPTNFSLAPGPFKPDTIVASVRHGLYVTELIGFGVNLVTGDYSRGAAGYWIENGELAYPVEEITIAGNLKDMLANIDMIGNDVVFRGRVASPTLKIREMTIAGN